MQMVWCLRKATIVACALALLANALKGQEQAAVSSEVVVANSESRSLIRVVFQGHKSWGRVQRGAVLEGRVSLPLYSGSNVVVPADSEIRVTVDSTEKIREQVGFWRKAGRVIVRAFNPIETNRPTEYRVALGEAELQLPDGEVQPLDVRVLRAGSGTLIRPKSDALKSAETPHQRPKASNILLLELDAENLATVPPKAEIELVATPAEGRAAKAYLLTGLRASENHQGDTFRAQLAEPITIAGRIFAPNSVVEGTVVRCAPPRMLSRAGRIYLRVDRIIPVEGEPVRVDGTLSSAETGAHSRIVLDEEGTLHGRKPGWMNGLVDAGYAYFIGKASDDIAETPIRAIGATMSNAAVANAARYVGLGASIAFLITRHGRDVALPKYSLIEISFGRVNETAAASGHD